MNPNKFSYKLGFDIGGTFTDIVVYDLSNKKTFLRKELTTTIDPSIAALAGLRSLIDNEKIRFQDLSKIIHGTTLAGNAIIERKGAETGLIATKGFGEILSIGRESRYDIYDLNPEFPEPLVKGALRLELTERTSASGQVLQSPSVQEIKVIIHTKEDILFAEEMAQQSIEEKRKIFTSKNFYDQSNLKPHLFLQPGWGHQEGQKLALEYVTKNPEWRLSLQTHKWLKID